MKIRSGFISNSSSSSFVCDVCGEVQSGWDIPIEDAGMYTCENNHTFCTDHKLSITNEDADKWIKTSEHKFDFIEWCEQEEFLLDLTGKQKLDEYMSSSMLNPYQVPSIYCPICNLKALKDSDVINYFFKKFDTNRIELLKEISARFKDNTDLQSFILSKSDMKIHQTNRMLLFLL